MRGIVRCKVAVQLEKYPWRHNHSILLKMYSQTILDEESTQRDVASSRGNVSLRSAGPELHNTVSEVKLIDIIPNRCGYLERDWSNSAVRCEIECDIHKRPSQAILLNTDLF